MTNPVDDCGLPRSPTKKLDHDVVVAMRRDGKTQVEIAHALGVTQGRISQVLQAHAGREVGRALRRVLEYLHGQGWTYEQMAEVTGLAAGRIVSVLQGLG